MRQIRAGSGEAVCRPTTERGKTERRNTHVEALRDLLADAGSTPAGSMKKASVTFGYAVLFLMSPAGSYALAAPAATTPGLPSLRAGSYALAAPAATTPAGPDLRATIAVLPDLWATIAAGSYGLGCGAG